MAAENLAKNIFVMPVLDKYLVYAPLHDISALVNKSAVLLLKNALSDEKFQAGVTEMAALIESLRSQDFRDPNRYGELDPQFLGIIPSRRCNMACAYCNFGANHASDEVIDPDIVISAIDYFAALTERKNKQMFSIQFFGGEPFVEQEIIDIAVHHARLVGAKTGLIPHFEVLTNGFLSEQQRVFIKNYFDRVVISFDGFKKYHDRTRPINSRQGSFEKVADTLKYLAESNIEIAIRCCITSESVEEMEAMTQWFCSEFQPDKVNFETLTQNSAAIEANLFPPDPFPFARGVIRSWRILRENSVEPAYAPVSLETVQTTSCPVGRDALIVHPDGLVASCYLLRQDWEEKNLDLSVGHVYKNGRVEIDLKKINQLRNLVNEKPRCTHCFCRFSCAGNCHVNCTFPGSSERYTDFCSHTRIITAASLLENLGQISLADQLLEDDAALSRLARQSSDNLFHFEA